jgi:hypothetical protein
MVESPAGQAVGVGAGWCGSAVGRVSSIRRSTRPAVGWLTVPRRESALPTALAAYGRRVVRRVVDTPGASRDDLAAGPWRCGVGPVRRGCRPFFAACRPPNGRHTGGWRVVRVSSAEWPTCPRLLIPHVFVACGRQHPKHRLTGVPACRPLRGRPATGESPAAARPCRPLRSRHTAGRSPPLLACRPASGRVALSPAQGRPDVDSPASRVVR